MKVKTSELIGAALDWAVAKCEGFSYEAYESNRKKWAAGIYRPQHWMPSTDWSQGGPIIGRGLSELYEHKALKCWAANSKDGYLSYGPTPLIAAMRCYVASKLGDEVDVPDEFC